MKSEFLWRWSLGLKYSFCYHFFHFGDLASLGFHRLAEELSRLAEGLKAEFLQPDVSNDRRYVLWGLATHGYTKEVEKAIVV